MSRPRSPVPAHLQFQQHQDELQQRNLSERFRYIYETNLWGAGESRSGPGSEEDSTRRLRAELPRLLQQVGAASMLDIPCGDFSWMQAVELGEVEYTGADIVPELIEANRRSYETPGARRRFLRLDLTRDALPGVDVVFCRDCLVHLSYSNIFLAFENLQRSGSRYLLTTTFPGHDINTDVEDGDWRLLNFEMPPFSLPQPEALIVEGCTEAGGDYADKSLALWRIEDLPRQPAGH
jgi:hypothetical protein